MEVCYAIVYKNLVLFMLRYVKSDQSRDTISGLWRKIKQFEEFSSCNFVFNHAIPKGFASIHDE
jgi:hypothetical protein